MNNVKRVLYYALKTFEWMFFLFVGAIAIINLSMLVQYKIMGRSVPTFMGYSYVRILSGSMEPTLEVGDMAICKVEDDYTVGEAILFEEGNSLVLHRIVDTTEDGAFITKGDANNVIDETPVLPENVHGTFCFRVPGMGDTMAFVTSWMGAFWLVLAALFVFLALDAGIDLLKDSIVNETEKSDAETPEKDSNEENPEEGESEDE